jgi:O-methyltransferase
MNFLAILREYRNILRLQKEMAKIFPSFQEQRKWIRKFKYISNHVESAHSESDILQFLLAIFKLSPAIEGCIVEAGAYKGGSTAKISLAAKHAGMELYVFDSFAGLPPNNEPHDKAVTGYSIRDWFAEGSYHGTLDEVTNNVSTYGDISVCHFLPGWFEDSLPGFKQKIALAYLDVDLAASTRCCLKYLYPLISPGGAIFSQDGDFPLVVEVFKDEKFWIDELGCSKIPVIKNMGKKITIILK